MYNAFISTTPRLRRHKKDDSPSTAGAGKVSAITARSKSELKELGERMGWTPRPLSMQEIHAMPSQQLLWEEAWNSDNYQRALELPGVIAENKKNMAAWDAKSLWDDQTQSTPQQAQAALDAIERFTASYPQFIRSKPCNQVVLLWLKERNLEISFTNLVQSFEENCLAGRVWLSPAAISVGSETEITSTELTKHRNFHLLLQAQCRVNPNDHLSADEYKAAHPELHDTRVPPMIQQGWSRAMATFVSMHPEFINTTESRERIFTALRQSKVNVTIQAIEEAFLHLAKNGELEIDSNKTVEGQAVRLTDLGGRR
jgi:hypothetical protein